MRTLKAVLAIGIIIAAIFADVEINETTFPDKNFRNLILSQNWRSDGVITDAEIAEITNLDLYKKKISDLTGIEHFSALKKLQCYSNKLTSIDLSKNTELTHLACWKNKLTSIDVSKNVKLKELWCNNNQLTFLDVSNNTALEYLVCSKNQLTSLDVSNNTALKDLTCYKNQLISLDLSNNTALKFLNCRGNKLTSLDLSKNTNLRGLFCNNNQLTSLNLSNNTALEYMLCHNNNIPNTELPAKPYFMDEDNWITLPQYHADLSKDSKPAESQKNESQELVYDTEKLVALETAIGMFELVGAENSRMYGKLIKKRDKLIARYEKKIAKQKQ